MSVDYVTPSPGQREELQDQVVQLQAQMRSAAEPIAAWSAYRRTLVDQARRYGASPEDVIGGGSREAIEALELLDAEIVQWAQAVGALEMGRATLVPYQVDGDPRIRWGVAEKGTVAGGLGLWPVVFTVLRVSAAALAGAATWMLTDAHIETERLSAEAESQRAQTDDRLTTLAEQLRDTNPDAAAVIAESIGKAREAAAQARNDTDSWLDRIGGAAGTAAAGIGGLAIGALAVLAWLAYEGGTS